MGQVSGGWLAKRLPTLVEVWLGNGSLPPGTARGVAREGTDRLEVALPSSFSSSERQEGGAVAKVVIGVDPHKRMNAVVVVDAKGKVLSRQQFPNPLCQPPARQL